ncbi:MAG: 23S rRNA (uracil(1939)-C(5))-methyltransferase RlmD [Patescibacteria group bacterium]|nr:23S rRNA (uracil(1939)-C(5))-methyltransferase RlmD [Patescibacteria group bacterium]MBU1034645.1 23S rRNA (uracil(1939)-C(5))-methyltransferase RlmD [Patescibacteria group bacterium]
MQLPKIRKKSFCGVISAFDDNGLGVMDGMAVPFSAVGDTVEAELLKSKKGVKILRLNKIIEAGADRIAPPCPYAGSCGGCLWQHLRYPAQLELKRGMVNAAFEGAGIETRIKEVMPCGAIQEAQKNGDAMPLHYRNRMDYCISWDGKIGLKEYGSWNRYLDLKTCLLLDEQTSDTLNCVRECMKELNLEPWDARFHRGVMRYVVIRVGKNTGERMIMLVVSDLAKLKKSARALIYEKLSPLCTSLLLGEQPLITDLSYVKGVDVLKGEAWLEETVNSIRYRIAPNSFFQTNTGMAAKLQNTVLNHFSKIRHSSFVIRHSVLDLYCGLGFFGIACAKRNPDMRVIGVELDAQAIELAKHNAAVNGVADRCSFTAAPAEDLSWQNLDADTVILDPPRSGLHPRVMTAILEMQPKRIIYVSCNYRRFAEEFKQLGEKYRIKSSCALDLFPHTPHVEIVSLLEIQKH